MKKYSWWFFLKHSFNGLIKNGAMTFASVIVLISCLVVLGTFATLMFNIDYNLQSITSLNVIVVYLDYDSTADQEAAVGAQLSQLDNVKNITFVSKADALQHMIDISPPEYKSLYEGFTPDTNPLSSSYNVEFNSVDKVDTLIYNINKIDGVRKVNNNLDISQKVSSAKNVIIVVFSWLLAILFVVSIFVIVNTIKLTVIARRQEILLMRHIGATNLFILIPFIIEGALIGLLSSVFAFLIQWYLSAFLFKGMISQITFVQYLPFSAVYGKIVLIFLLAGLFAGIFGSAVSTRRYLKA